MNNKVLWFIKCVYNLWLVFRVLWACSGRDGTKPHHYTIVFLFYHSTGIITHIHILFSFFIRLPLILSFFPYPYADADVFISQNIYTLMCAFHYSSSKPLARFIRALAIVRMRWVRRGCVAVVPCFCVFIYLGYMPQATRLLLAMTHEMLLNMIHTLWWATVGFPFSYPSAMKCVGRLENANEMRWNEESESYCVLLLTAFKAFVFSYRLVFLCWCGRNCEMYGGEATSIQ